MIAKYRFLLLIIFLSTFSLGLVVEKQDDNITLLGRVALPTETRDHRFFLKPKLKSGEELTFFTDTGGGFSIFFKNSLTKYDFKIEEIEIRDRTMPAISWMDFDPKASIPVDTSGIDKLIIFPSPPQIPISDGFLGSGYFSGKIWEFNYKEGIIYSITEVLWDQRDSKHRIEFKLGKDEDDKVVGSHPAIEVTIAGETYDLLFDTGATLIPTEEGRKVKEPGDLRNYSASYIKEEIMNKWRKEHPEWPFVEGGDMGGKSDLIQVPAVTIAGLESGPAWFASRPDKTYDESMLRTSGLKMDGAVGGNVLKSYNVITDYKNGLAEFIFSNTTEVTGQSRLIPPDLSGLKLFWTVADTLASGNNLSDASWNKLFQHQGYKLLGDIAQRDDELKTCIPAVFNPLHRSKLDSLLANGTRLEQRICTHLIRVRNMRNTLEKYADTLDFKNFIEQAYEQARIWLPNELPNVNSPSIYITLHEPVNFGHDGVITYDLLTFMDRTRQDNILTIGHEMHHAYSTPLRQVKIHQNMEGYHILALFRRLQSEGIASMIDKVRFISNPPKTYETSYEPAVIEGMKEGYQKSPAALQLVDSLLATAEIEAESLSKVGDLINDVLSKVDYQPHIPGLYMAKTIAEQLGPDRLIATNANLFDFIYSYHEAKLQQSSRPAWSFATLQLFKQLEKAYNQKTVH